MEMLAAEVVAAMNWVSDELQLLAEDGPQTEVLVAPLPPSPRPPQAAFPAAAILLLRVA
jgi:hypothetical protein